jgi:hypothetical protein
MLMTLAAKEFIVDSLACILNSLPQSILERILCFITKEEQSTEPAQLGRNILSGI